MELTVLLVILNFYSCSGVFFAKSGDVLFSYNVTKISVCRTDKNSFRSILGINLSDCVQECGLRQHCEGLSYGRKLRMCNLFMTKENAYFINEDCIYVTNDDIKVEMSPCNVVCPYGQVCDVTSGGCMVKECLRASIKKGTVLGNNFEIGCKIYYTCKSGFVSKIKTDICREDGTFSAIPVCEKVVKNCADVKSCNSSYIDGEYWIEVDAFKGRKIKVYCYGMSTVTPLEYITVDENRNYGYDAGKDDVMVGNKTKYNKIRVNVESMRVMRDDVNFTNKPSSIRPYAVAASCNCVGGCPPWKGYFKISTEGTGLKFSDEVTWKTVGWIPGMANFSRNSESTVISANCGGYCGYCQPSDPLLLYYNEKEGLNTHRTQKSYDAEDIVHKSALLFRRNLLQAAISR